MKKILKEYWYLWIFTILLNLFVFVGLCINVKYDVIAPAGITNVSANIQIKDANPSNINVVSVYSYSNVNLLSYLIGKINQNATISKTSEYEVTDLDLVYTSGVIQKRVSIYNSIVSGYKLAGFDEIIDESSYKGYIIHTLTTYADSQLKIGDIITGFNNCEFVGLTGKNEFDELTSSIVFEQNKMYPINILRYNSSLEKYEKLSFNIKTDYFYQNDLKTAAFGISAYEYIVPTKSENIPQYSWNYGDSIGPSGGLMQSLYVYEALTGNKLTKNLKIVGTGTVDAYGNAGLIGGIAQKVIAANLAGADIFFVPVTSKDEKIYKNESNYIDALASYQNLNNPKMKLVVVSCLEDIINYLKTI